IATQLTIATNETVTGDHDREWVAAVGVPHRPRCPGEPKTLGQLPVGQCGAKGNALQLAPDALLKWRANWGYRQGKLTALALEIFLQLLLRDIQLSSVLLPCWGRLYWSVATLEL